METNAAETLDVNQVFAYRLHDARRGKDWSQRQLAAKMREAGIRMSHTAIAKIEAARHGVGGHFDQRSGQTRPRHVTLEEAIAFAAVLDVPPPSLFLPIFRGDEILLAPDLPAVDVDTAHAWTRGEQPLRSDPSSAPLEGRAESGQTYRFRSPHAGNEQFYRSQTYAPKTTAPTLADLERLGVRVVIEPTKGDER